MAKILSFTGGHDIHIYAGCVYDPASGMYKGGVRVATVPFGGRRLTATTNVEPMEPLDIDGVKVPLAVSVPDSINPMPSPEECDYFVVSGFYAHIAQLMGCDTSRMLTVRGKVIDENGRIIGCTGFSTVGPKP